MGDNLSTVNLGNNKKALQIAAGVDFTCAILDDSSLKCWGNNQYGQLGLGNTDDVGRAASDMGENLQSVDLGTGRYATYVSLGKDHACALLDNSTVKCWGRNSGGLLGLGNTDSKGFEPNTMGDNLLAINLGTGRTARQVEVANNHTCVILDNSTVKCWGDGQNGALATGGVDDLGAGPNDLGDFLDAIDLGTGRTAMHISMGLSSTCALLDNSDIKCWGNNSSGELGLGDENNRGDQSGEMGDTLDAISLGTGLKALKIASGNSHQCAIVNNSALKCWGVGSAGQLGQGNSNTSGDAPDEMGDNLKTVDLGFTGRLVRQVDAGAEFACAITGESTVKCWGDNSKGQVGIGSAEAFLGDDTDEMRGDLNSVDLGTGRFARNISVGGEFACAVLDTSDVKCWGFNDQGQLGQGNTDSIGAGATDMSTLNAIDLNGSKTSRIVAGTKHACATLSDSSIKCWGDGTSGQLGDGNYSSLGDEGSEMGGNLSSIILGGNNLGTNQSLAASESHSCAILGDSTVKCWGDGGFGKLGQESDTNSPDPNALTAINLGTNLKARVIETSKDNSCAILNDSTVKCWGLGSVGVGGQGDTNDIGAEASTMGDNLNPIDLGTAKTSYQLSMGDTFACSLLDDSSIKCWGTAGDGEFGEGDGAASVAGTGSGQMGDALATIDLGTNRFATQVSCGSEYVCALLDDSQVKCWGKNANAQLGIGDQNTRGNDPGEMGNNLDEVLLFEPDITQ